MFTDDDNQWEEEDDDLTGEAVARFEEMLESQNPSYFDVEEFELIIDYYMQENDLKKSRKAVETALEQHPEDFCINVKVARQYLLENQPEKASEILEKLGTSNDDPDYHLTLGSCYAALGDHEKAIDIYKDALDYFYDDEKTELYHAIGIEYQCLNSFDQAIEYLKLAIDAPKDGSSYLNPFVDLIQCYSSSGKDEEGIAYFKERIENDPHDAEAWSAVADLYRRQDMLEEAIDHYEYALAIDPTLIWANMQLANCYYDLQRYKEAIDSLQEAVANHVDTALIHASLGDCYYQLHKYFDAKDEYNKALKCNEFLTEAWSGLGYIYSDLGDSQTAIQYFNKAYELEPFNDDHLYNLAAEYRKVNQLDKALSFLLDIEKHQPSDPDLYFFLSDLLAEMNRMDEALCYLKIGLQRTDKAPCLLYLMAYLLLECNERQTALYYLEEALQADPDGGPEFVEYNPEMLLKDLEIMEMIGKRKTGNGERKTEN